MGAPGSLNDINVLNESPLYDGFVHGEWPPANRHSSVNGRERSMLYYLPDGIYPSYLFLVSPYSKPKSQKEKTFTRLQEAVHKDVERPFAVVTARFHEALTPREICSVETLNTTSRAVATLHNVVVEQRRKRFTGRQRMASADALRIP